MSAMIKASIACALTLTAHQTLAQQPVLSANTAEILLSAQSADPLIQLLCDDTPERGEIMVMAETLNLATPAELLIGAGEVCASEMADLAGFVGVAMPDRVVEIALGLADAQNGVPQTFLDGLRDSGIDVDAVAVELVQGVNSVYGFAAAANVAAALAPLSDRSEDLARAADFAASNSDDADFRSQSMFERNDNLPLNIAVFSDDVGAPTGGQAPSAN